MNYDWEDLGAGVWRTRLPFLDVTVGLVCGSAQALLVDSGTTLIEAHGIESDVAALSGQRIGHIVLTHNHFDHILGSSWFKDAEIHCAPEVAETMAAGRAHLRADAIDHGADVDEVDRAIAAMTVPTHRLPTGEIDLGGRTVSICRPGPGHTRHDLIVTVPNERTVVFCGDLVEQSGDPVIDEDSDLEAWPATLDAVLRAGAQDGVFVPGHGAVVDSHFIRLQQGWLRARRPC
ncbi:MBL fold metallo-hydrolase [Mycolicibacterium sp. (ex Dasyatis americana)]|uniref:MBL fold metallo-hydrolase n=1 Tax=Mycobacterium syngnathidarum TaxID=1908205 RepID=A0A1S1K4B1_9MYCO|nr:MULTISPECIES: MBL fold metallo-hydrolase [Mycobacterium]MCG7609059.1 MBL fold metallo-hydrolase [Mycobacterium sp. CnD-18-1]OFB35738.1 MBL fold metallo-hydrolase [Mycolicibacterium sp. (ex Dasyatis americana)]OHT96431.1 MBL fold metallo-hydrolase [Mycobacterium syngnathidarum]OLT93290.1 MBL fold metallo-hydrolase [Mycobacterium syngnathidarum]